MVKFKKYTLSVLLVFLSVQCLGSVYYISRRDTGFYSYSVNQSCRFNDDDSAHTTWTPGSAADDLKKWSFSFWMKRGNLSSTQYILSAGTGATQRTMIYIVSDQIRFYSNQAVVRANVTADPLLRDTTSWYHILVTLDAVNAEIKFYINGVEADQTVSTAVANVGYLINSTVANSISKNPYLAQDYFDGYLAEVYMIDGLELTPDSFGEFKNNVWIPKAYSGSYGTNGYYLDFLNSSDFGEDQSGNGNDFTDSGLASNDQVSDTPTNNYCVLNTIQHLSTATIANGSLECSGAENEFGNFGLRTGKWGWQITVGENGDFGIEDQDKNEEIASDVSGEVVEMLLDLDNGTLKKKVDGGSLEDIELSVDTTQTWFPYFKAQAVMDFGQQSYSPTETGYKTISSSNFSDPTIIESYQGFYAQTRTGTGAEATISDVNFSVDQGALIWIKRRDGVTNNYLSDTVRGGTETIFSDSSAAEQTITQGIKSFTSNGYVLGTDVSININSGSFIDWVFRKGVKYGLDIVTFTGTGAAHEESHNLESVPELIIIKNRTDTASIPVYHALAASDPETDVAFLDVANAFIDDSTYWNDTAPTSTHFTVGTSNLVNGSGDDIVAYLFLSIPGYSKAISYTGNGNADGPYVDCGFKPRWILIKGVTVAQNWIIHDAVRNTYNITDSYLLADLTNAESSGIGIDILSQGFKIKTANVAWNSNSVLYIGMAFAEQPGKWSNAR